MLKQTFILVFLFFSGMSHSFAQEILTLDSPEYCF